MPTKPERLRVRVYNVRFGDAILVSVPDRAGAKTTQRHILIDVGNAHHTEGEGGADVVFADVVADVRKQLGRRALDLYVMTHEHLDHVQGLKLVCGDNAKLRVSHAWLTGSAHPSYYQDHDKAREKKDLARSVFRSVRRFLAAAPDHLTPMLKVLLATNDEGVTEPCVEYLRNLAPPDRTAYVHRELALAGTHPFREAKLEVWAPEEDTSEYYGRFTPLALGLAESDDDAPDAADGAAGPLDATPPPGVDAGAFYDLVEARRSGFGEALQLIDRANNNSSVVFSLAWRGWNLLFTGDAEQRSWREMEKEGMLRPVHFLKVSHHGSDTGMPPVTRGLLDKIFPEPPPDDRPRCAAVSTYRETHNRVPDDLTLQELAKRGATVVSTDDVTWSNVPFDDTVRGVFVDEKKRLKVERHPKNLYVDFLFEGTQA